MDRARIFTFLISVFLVSATVVVVRELLRNRKEKYQPNDVLDDIVREMYVLSPKVQSLKFSEGDKSYTINKKDVFVCMRDEHGEYYDKNFLKFVILHEISHALCDEIGHTPKFSRIFANVLKTAARLGIYDPSGKKITNYCNYK